MRYRQNTKGDILYGPPVIPKILRLINYRLIQNYMSHFRWYKKNISVIVTFS